MAPPKARAIKAGEAEVIVAGGVESMSRAPFVMAKADSAFSRKAEIYDTTIGWRFINPKLEEMYGVDAMGETAENLAEERQTSREDQDKFANWSQEKAKAAQDAGRLAEEIVPATIPQRRGDDIVVEADEHLRLTSVEKLGSLRAAFKKDGTVTAGNASGVNDGAAALLIADEETARKNGLKLRARVVGAATAGVPPRIMGCGPVPAIRKLLDKHELKSGDIDYYEINAAFAVVNLHAEKQLDVSRERCNLYGGGISLGHPPGATGARMTLVAMQHLVENEQDKGIISMCMGAGQGLAMLIERVRH